MIDPNRKMTGNQPKDTTSKRGSASLAEVARAAGVSKMTASRVLNNKSGFSEETRQKVIREVERLGYVPNRLAAAFGSEKASTLVGICVPRLTSSLFGEVLESIDRTLSRYGYQPMIGANDHSAEAEEKWLRGLLSWRPAGVILSGRTRTAAALELLKASSSPVVEIWELNTSPLDMSVGFNHFDSGFEMGRFLVSRGRRKIGYVGALSSAPGTGSLRLEGFAKALTAGGLTLAGSELLHDRPGFYAGYYGAETLLNRVQDLDAIYFQNDAMAIGGMSYCQQSGLDVPGDIGIAGWGGMEAASILPMRLTTTTVPTHSVGKTAAELLLNRLKNEPCDDVVIVPTRLVPGSTV